MVVITERALDAQHAVLGAMLLDERCIAEVMSKVSSSDFTSDPCLKTYLTIKHLFDHGEPIDPVTVSATLRQLGGEDWRKFMLDLMDITPSSANVMEYVQIMQDAARIAQLQDIGEQLRTITDLDDARALMDKANGLFVAKGNIRRLNMQDMLADFWERHQQTHNYLTWGFSKLDKGIYAEPGDMIVLGGYPSAGKTALAVSMAYHLSESHRVGFYSLETSQYKLADRLVSHVSKLTMPTIKHGNFNLMEWEAVTDKVHAMQEHHLEVIEAGGMTVTDIRADALAHRFDCIVVDYLQLIQTNRRGTRSDEVADISRSLHALSQQDKITVLALSQLSRPEKTGAGKAVTPTMQSLRESGQIEQDADVVMLLYQNEDEDAPAEQRILKIAKNKEGEKGKIFLDFDGLTQTFIEVEKTSSAQSDLNAAGRAVKQTQRAKCATQQLTLEEITGTDPALPFS